MTLYVFYERMEYSCINIERHEKKIIKALSPYILMGLHYVYVYPVLNDKWS